MFDSAQLKQQDTSIVKKNEVFKHWFNDTIKKIDTGSYNNAGKLININIRKVLKVPPDSLALSIFAYYDCKVSSKYKIREGNDLDNFLLLLKEYDEYPKNDFLIKFYSNYFYYPSAVRGLPYDMVFKINDIEVRSLDGSSISKYSYIRGSLSYKDVILKNKNGDIKNKRIDFVWDDGKLKKTVRE
jgi:hypothetical protein